MTQKRKTIITAIIVVVFLCTGYFFIWSGSGSSNDTGTVPLRTTPYTP